MADYPDKSDANFIFGALARKTLKVCLKKTLAGAIRLRVPAMQGPLRPAPRQHFHFMPELFLQLEGVNIFELPHERFRLCPGELCIIPRGMPHEETVRLRRGCFAMFVFQYYLEGLRFHLSRGEEGQYPRHLRHITIPYQRILRTGEYLEDIVQILQAGQPGSSRIVRWLLSAHLAELITILKAMLAEDRKSAEPFKIIRTKQLIQLHASNPKLSVHNLAEMLHCSADYLSHLFHSRTGATLSGYINHYRLSQAKYLLLNTTMNIKEIAYAVGYVDPDYFGRLFRVLTGQPPARYRRLFISNGVKIKGH